MSELLGRLAYEAYLEACGGRSLVSGDELPEWDDQSPEIKAAWDHVGDAVLSWRRELS